MSHSLDIYNYVFKLIVIGDSGVGKSNILSRSVENIFDESHISTIGIDFKIKYVTLIDIDYEDSAKIIKFQIWDTAGQDRFKTLVSSYYRGATVAFIVFDLNNTESFDAVDKWNLELNKFADPNIIRFYIGNKSDLEPCLSKDEIRNKCGNTGETYFELSAKNNLGIDNLFKFLAHKLSYGKRPHMLSRHIGITFPSNQFVEIVDRPTTSSFKVLDMFGGSGGSRCC